MMQRHKCVFLYINASFFGVAINFVIVYCLGYMYIEIQYKYEIQIYFLLWKCRNSFRAPT